MDNQCGESTGGLDVSFLKLGNWKICLDKDGNLIIQKLKDGKWENEKLYKLKSYMDNKNKI